MTVGHSSLVSPFEPGGHPQYEVPSRMLAWQSDEPGRAELTLAEIATPKPGPNESLIAVEAAALNFSDLLMIDGTYQVRPPRPFVPGQEIAGTVVQVGKDSPFEPGQRVASKVLRGGFAPFASVRNDMAIPVPDRISITAAAALPVVYTTAMVALSQNAEAMRGATILVLAAAGGVGLAAVQLAKAMGARVIAAAGSEDKRALARQHGADETIDYRSEDWAQAVKDLTDDRGVGFVFDPVGGSVTTDSLRCLARGGRIFIVGFASGEIPKIPANKLLLKRASAVGVYWSHDLDGAMIAEITNRLVTMLEGDEIVPVVDEKFGLRDLPAALEELATRRSSGKLVLRVGQHPNKEA